MAQGGVPCWALHPRLPTPGPFNPAVVFGRNFRGQERFFAGSTDPHTGGLCLVFFGVGISGYRDQATTCALLVGFSAPSVGLAITRGSRSCMAGSKPLTVA